jgi:hypothetical protein
MDIDTQGSLSLGGADAGRSDSRGAYEPPRLIVHGTIADVTRGILMISTDGLAPGSAL